MDLFYLTWDFSIVLSFSCRHAIYKPLILLRLGQVALVGYCSQIYHLICFVACLLHSHGSFFYTVQFLPLLSRSLSNYRFTCLRIPCRDFVLPYNCRTTKYIKVNYFVRKSINVNNTGVVVGLRNNCTRAPELPKLNSRRGRAKPNLFDIHKCNKYSLGSNFEGEYAENARESLLGQGNGKLSGVSQQLGM